MLRGGPAGGGLREDDGALLGGRGADSYDRFVAAVDVRHRHRWLAEAAASSPPGPILDLTPPRPGSTPRAPSPTHPVVALRADLRLAPVAPGEPPVPAVRGDHVLLDCIRSESLAGVIAGAGSLDDVVMLEQALTAMQRALQPGGRLLLCVPSALAGMARLAADSRWAELADAPQADVILVPDAAEGFTRCYSAGDLVECVTEAGLAPLELLPRTVLPREAVARAEAAGALPELVETEVRLARDNEGREVGHALLLAAEKPR